MIHSFGVTNVDSAADSTEELAFLKMIWANYSDPIPKLVYADWLDERGDPRAGYLRRFVDTLDRCIPKKLPKTTTPDAVSSHESPPSHLSLPPCIWFNIIATTRNRPAA